jgi:adenosylmethionine-8-amino-7-oxononanoate aminotransferase
VKNFPRAVRGEGVYLWDDNGNRYLDFCSSAAVNLIGHGVREIADAMAGQARQLEFVHSSQFTTPIAENYASELLAFAGPNFAGGRVYFTSGGSEAVETALKLARQYQVEIGHPERYQILSRKQSYHGASLGALAVSGNQRRRLMYLPMVRESTHVGMPYCYRCSYDCTDGCRNCGLEYAAELDHAFERANCEAAAFIFEPVSGATLGAVVPPPGYLQKIEEVCRKHNALLIADEVMTGMGRTGRNFAVEHWDVTPDVLVAAKGLSSGYAPLGAVIATKQVADAIAGGSGTFVHGFTYNAHPVSLAAGQAVLHYLQERSLVRAADSEIEGTPAHRLKELLSTLSDLPSVGEVRGIGLLWAIEFVADKKTKEPFGSNLNFAGCVAAAAMQRGVVVYPMQGCVDGTAGDHVLVAPPAVIMDSELQSGVEQLGASIRDAAQKHRHPSGG